MYPQKRGAVLLTTKKHGITENEGAILSSKEEGLTHDEGRHRIRPRLEIPRFFAPDISFRTQSPKERLQASRGYGKQAIS